MATKNSLTPRHYSFYSKFWRGAGLVAFLFLVVGLLAMERFGWNPWAPLPGEQRDFQRMKVGGKSIEVVLAWTPAQIQQGLSGRETIGAEGMFFLFSRPVQLPFWMLGMKFPLDFIWIVDGKVVDIHENVSEPNTPTTPPQVVTSSQPVTAVLEVPAGFVAENQIKRGDVIQFVGERYQKVW